MTTHVSPSTAAESALAVRNALGVANDETGLSLHSAAVRTALWAWSHDGTVPVYVTRFLNNAYSWIQHADLMRRDDSHVTPLREVLSELELLGDVMSRGGGYWLPAPLRTIALDAGHHGVLVGGTPSSRLPMTLRAFITHHGAARIFSGADLDASTLPVQSASDWLRRPPLEVAMWAERVLTDARLDPLLDGEASLDYYTPYPSGRMGGVPRFQYERWIERPTRLEDGRYLARREVITGLVTHHVAEIKDHRLVALGSLHLIDGDVRRLQYGVDALSQHPVLVSVQHSQPKVRFVLQNELPSAEHRLFTALGTLKLPENGRYYPRVWYIPHAHVGTARQALATLGVKLEDV